MYLYASAIQWRIQDFCKGDAAGVWGRSPQRGLGGRAPGGGTGSGWGGGEAHRKAEHFL